MIDPRDGVAREWIGHLLDVTFAPTRGLSREAQREWAQDLQEAVRDALPKRDRQALLDLLERARKRLRQKARTVTWPSVCEVLVAIREVVERVKTSDGCTGESSWPHANSEKIVETTIKWLRNFGDWPTYLKHPRAVAQTLIDRGEFTLRDLIRAGYPAAPAELRDAGIVFAPQHTTKQ